VENGCKTRKPGEEWVENTENFDFEWLDSVIEVVKYFADRTPGSSTYTTQVTIDWSYANARYEIGTN